MDTILSFFAESRLKKEGNARALLQQGLTNQGIQEAAAKALSGSTAHATGAAVRGAGKNALVGAGVGGVGGGAYGAFANPEDRLGGALRSAMTGAGAGAIGGGAVGLFKAPGVYARQLAQNDERILSALAQQAGVKNPLETEKALNRFVNYYGKMKPKKEQAALDALSSIQL